MDTKEKFIEARRAEAQTLQEQAADLLLRAAAHRAQNLETSARHLESEAAQLQDRARNLRRTGAPRGRRARLLRCHVRLDRDVWAGVQREARRRGVSCAQVVRERVAGVRPASGGAR